MKVISVRLAWHLFVGAILVLAIIAVLADRAGQQYASSEAWVSHTRQVESQIAILRADIAMAANAQYQATADSNAAARYQRASSAVPLLLDELQNLTSDSPVEQSNISRLRVTVTAEMQPIAAGMASPIVLGPADRALVGETAKDAANTNAILDSMNLEEEGLLNARRIVSAQRYRNLRAVLGVGFLCVLAVLIFSFRTLLSQLAQRIAAEGSIRRLSAHILRIQDDERRRLARELHDGLGQIFAGLNMEIGSLFRTLRLDENQKQSLTGAQQMATEGLLHTRTISYLLHPPMLDDFGFEQATKWYVEGFSSRSRIDVSLKVTQPFRRMPDAMELVLFRVIQEGLTNVHRHSESSRVEIVASQHPDRVSLTIRDFGKGIPHDTLQAMEETSSGAGVGLGGMRERVAEMGGHLAIESGAGGTTLNVSLPFPVEEESYAGGGPTMDKGAIHTAPAKASREDFHHLPRVALEN